jgi:nitric oxide reductase NorQ protein
MSQTTQEISNRKGKVAQKQAKVTNTTPLKCEECGNETPNFWGIKQGKKWCNSCYKRHKRNDPNMQRVVSVVASNPPESLKDNPDDAKKIISITKSIPDMSRFIPNNDGYIPQKIGDLTDIEILDRAYKNKQNVLIIGGTGSGKSSCTHDFCFRKQIPYIRINLNGGTTPDELIGQFIPDEDKGNGAIKWQDGLLTTFVRYGGCAVLEEVNAIPPEISFCLHGLTDDYRKLILTQKDGEVIQAHPNFFLVCCMNENYEGTHPLNQAFKDRFRILEFNYNEKAEKKIVKDELMLNLAVKLRVMKMKGEINTPISTRMLKYYTENVEIYGQKVALQMFLNSFEPFEREPIKNVLEMIKRETNKSADNQGEQNDTNTANY